MGLGAAGALAAAFMLWKLYALPKISRWITEQGALKLRGFLKRAIEHPDGEEGAEIGKLAGVVFSYALDGIEELASTKEGRDRLKPLLEMAQEHIQQSIFATWGHIMHKLQEGGEGNGAGIPPMLAGLGEAIIPKAMKEKGVDLQGILGIARYLGLFNGGGLGGAPGGNGGNGGMKGDW